MRQVDAAELHWNIRWVIRNMSATRRKGLAAREDLPRRQAEDILADEIAQRLRQYEIMSDTPVSAGSDLFTAAAYGIGKTSIAE